MASDAKQLYDDSIRALPPKERLQLAALILDGLAKPGDFDDAWTEQDMHDLVTFSLSLTHDSKTKTP